MITKLTSVRLLPLCVILLVLAAGVLHGGEEDVESELADLPVIGRSSVSFAALERHLSIRHPDIDPIYLSVVYRTYRDECLIENVSLVVALAQMIHETDHLLFTGSVAPVQYNFAGLGVTGGGVSGLRFFDIRAGIRAHVQHLKAYGDDETLSRPLVDPRFHYVQRGSAPTVNALTGRWATDPEYGPKVLAHAHRLLELTGVPPGAVP